MLRTGKDEGIKLVCPHCVPAKNEVSDKVFYFVGVPTGLNPCYRRERATLTALQET